VLEGRVGVREPGWVLQSVLQGLGARKGSAECACRRARVGVRKPGLVVKNVLEASMSLARAGIRE